MGKKTKKAKKIIEWRLASDSRYKDFVKSKCFTSPI